MRLLKFGSEKKSEKNKWLLSIHSGHNDVDKTY